MILAERITQFDCTEAELQERLLFWMVVAGKTAEQMARKLDRFLANLHAAERTNDPLAVANPYFGYSAHLDPKPFYLVQWHVERETVRDHLQLVKMGKYRLLEEGFREVIKLDPRTCTLEELETIPGIGPKTARCFLLHSRPNQRLAGLDTHILKWLASKGYNVPRATPTGKLYGALEELFLAYADRYALAPADLDLRIWNHYARGEALVLP